MRRWLVSISIATFVFFLVAAGVPLVSAQDEYTGGKIALRDCLGIANPVFGCWDESHPLAPRIACSPDNSKCVMLVYENRSGFQSLRIKYSVGVAGKHFENLVYGCPVAGTFASWWDWVFGGCLEVEYINSPRIANTMRQTFNTTINIHRGYDVQYVNGNFYVVANIYEMDGDRATVYLVNSTGAYPTGYSFYPYPTTPSNNYMTSFCDDSSHVIATAMSSGSRQQNVSGTVFDCDHFDVYVVNDIPPFTGTGAWYYNIFNNTDTSSKQGWTTYNVSGFVYLNAKKGFGAFPTDYSGLDYYSGGQVIYQRNNNATWITHTSDFITYYNTTIYYTWDVGKNESLYSTDVAVDDTNRVYAYDRYTNVSGEFGVYVFNEPVYSFEIRARGVDVNTMSIMVVNVSVAISCNNNSWYYTASGVDPTLITPCQTNNTIFITASGWQPDIVYLTGIDSLNPTGVTVITAPASGFGFVRPYNVKFGAFDKFAAQPIQGATMSVDGVPKTTGSNGIANYTLSPYQSANFYLSNSSNTYYLSLFGTPELYDVYVSKTGYVTSDIYQVNLTSSSVPTGNSSFLRTYNIQLEPTNARLIVDVWWSDGIHYNGDTAVVRVGGNNGNIYLESGGILYSQNYATSFPATFVLQDNRTSWTANTNVTYGSYFDTENIAVTSSVFYYFHDFYLPNSSTTHECTSDLGCGGTFCKSNIWYYNGRCQTGVCAYSFVSCVLCDDDAGCYTETTNQTCPTGLDFECVDQNYCIDSKNLASYKCSSSNTCFKSVEVCDYMCDSTEKVCLAAPAAVQCDQSTVTGLLGCLQAGILNFINATYNPMFLIMVAIFIAVMISAFFILVYKGIISVTS